MGVKKDSQISHTSVTSAPQVTLTFQGAINASATPMELLTKYAIRKRASVCAPPLLTEHNVTNAPQVTSTFRGATNASALMMERPTRYANLKQESVCVRIE